mgnify:CR=1 FL=1
MNLNEEQRKIVATWVGQGLKLSEIQTRLISELGVRLILACPRADEATRQDFDPAFDQHM